MEEDNQLLETEIQQTSAPASGEDEYAYLNEDTNYTDTPIAAESEDVETVDEQAATDDDSSPVEEAPDKSGKPHNKRAGYYARINQAQRRRDEEIEHLRQQNLLLMQQMQTSQKAAPAAPVDEATAQAQQIENWVKSVAAEMVQKEVAPLKQLEEERHLRTQERQFNSELSKAAKRYADFDSLVTFNPEIKKDTNLMGAAQLLPNAPDVLYHLGRNPDLLYEVKDLPPIPQAARLVKISQDIAVRTQQKKFTNASPPITRSGATGTTKHAGSNKSLGSMTQDDYEAEVKSWYPTGK